MDSFYGYQKQKFLNISIVFSPQFESELSALCVRRGKQRVLASNTQPPTYKTFHCSRGREVVWEGEEGEKSKH